MNASLRMQVRILERRADRVRGRVCGTCGKPVAASLGAERIILRVPMPPVMGENETVASVVPPVGCPECESSIVLRVPPPRRLVEA